MKLIGLTGGAGSGKSTVSRMFGALGAAIVDADEAAHAVYEPGMPAFDDIVSTFGREFVGDDGRIDRARLGELVFSDAEARRRLNAIVHPRVRDWMADRTVEAVERGVDIVLQDVPLLFENGLQGLYSRTILVYARPETQISRLVGERGISRDRAERMVGSQMPIDEKKALADYLIDNDGPVDDTRHQVDEVWARVRAL